ILDQDIRFPLPGATVQIKVGNEVRGAITDKEGRFHFDDIPVGRIDMVIGLLGYREKQLSNIAVGSGRETVLSITLEESAVRLDEIVVTPEKVKGGTINEMSMVSNHVVTVSETKQFAGSFNDPSRMVTAFAGITS